ncbi:TFIIB-type zinc ribbon-containing protein [Chitinimonas naiadis]
MQCPVCKETTLVMAERQGIEIDYCPQCRGVWLDRGELDKLIERSQQELAAAAPTRPVPEERPRQDGHWGNERGHHDKHRGHDGKYHGKKSSFWNELFD